jgi:hypothetical protein
VPVLVQIGFLYLRYVCPPKELWEWLGPFCGDREVRQQLCRQQVLVSALEECAFAGHVLCVQRTVVPALAVLEHRSCTLQLSCSLNACSSRPWTLHLLVPLKVSTNAASASCSSWLSAVSLLQEIQPSGPNAATVTLGDYVRDLLLEQVSACSMCNSNNL